MKDLSRYITEGILGNVDDIMDTGTRQSIKKYLVNS